MIEHVEAHAKLTRSLHITGVRSDGYHEIDAEMVTLEWHDTLTIAPGGDGLSASGPFAVGVPLDPSNLVARALHLAGRRAHIHIDKQLPHGGGLGGGSADAAAVLRWAGFTDIGGAASLGADVPFCMVGGRARVTGIGDRVHPLPTVHLDVTVVVPPMSCSTPTVYAAWDALGGPGHEINDLQPAAIAAYPELATWRDRIREACGHEPALAGSGATWFVEGHHELAEALTGALVVTTCATPG